MSTKQKYPVEWASALAYDLCARLLPYCQRIEVAGSIRRGTPYVGDIELCVIPIFGADMFGNPFPDSALDALDWSEFGCVIKSGHKYKQIEVSEGINLDLFIVTPPAQFGVVFLLRTGPADFSHRFVTHKQHGGLLPAYLRVKDGALWKGGEMLLTPEEGDVFQAIGIPYITPQERK